MKIKWMICTFVLLSAFSLRAQELGQPNESGKRLDSWSQEQPAPIPDAGGLDTNDPAVTLTVTADSVTLPGDIYTLRRNALAYSVAQPNETAMPLPGAAGPGRVGAAQIPGN